MKILVVEDNEQLNKALSTLLKRNDYLVDSAFDGEEALLYLEDHTYDVVVLDIMLPIYNGLDVLKRARKLGVKTPVILLTAKSTVEDKIKGLDSGADDYLAKPFDSNELLARIRALTRRVPEYIENKVITFGDLSLSINDLKLTCGQKSVQLSNKELQIMDLLMSNKGNITSLDSITNKAWDIDAYSTSENVWVFISYLRKKIESIDSKVTIKSVRYQGYYLEYQND